MNDLRGLRVLVIDDDGIVRSLLKRVLEEAGCTVSCAEDAETGIRLASDLHPSLAFVDMILPGIPGIKAIDRLREILPSIRIIAISAGGRLAAADHLEMATRLGANTSLLKPLEKRTVLQAIRNLPPEQ